MNRWPPPVEMEAMKLFAVPANCRKLVHRWDDRKRMPLVKELRSGFWNRTSGRDKEVTGALL